MINLELNDDGFVGHQLREPAREHGYDEAVDNMLSLLGEPKPKSPGDNANRRQN